MREKSVRAVGAFLRTLFENIAKGNLSYCVLRNYEDLPNSAGGSDIDIAVLPESQSHISTLILQAAEIYGGHVIVDYTGSGRFIRVLGFYNDEWWGVAIDLFGSIEFKGVEYLATRKIIKRGRNHGDIRVASDSDAVIIALIKELVANGKSRKGYLNEARQMWLKEGRECLSLYNGSLSEKTLNQMGVVLSTSDLDVELLVGALRSDIMKSGEAWPKLYNFWTRIRRLWKTPGISVAVLGTDGAGKTTLIDAVMPVLEQALHSPIHYEHLRPNWIPRLGRIAGKTDTREVVENPHSQESSGIVGSFVRLIYYAIDYYFGYWIKIHPKLAKGAKLVLFDRYYYDFLMDPMRMRISLPKWVIKLVFIVVPKPQLVLCLGSDPETIYSRKPETSLEEVTRQVACLRNLCRKSDSTLWIDTGESLDAASGAALNAIVRVMYGRLG